MKVATSRERMMEKRTRLTYLQEVDRQEEKRCDNCKNADSVKASKCSCPAAVRIRQIGQLLEGKKVEPTKKEEPKMVAEQKELTVAMIDDLRAQGESWEQIGKRMGVTGVTAKNRYDRMKGEQPKPELKEVKKQQDHAVDRLELIRQLESRDAEIELLKARIEELESEREAEKKAFYKLRDENEELDRFNAELMERDKQNKNRIHNLESAIEDERDRRDRDILSVRNKETEISEYWRGEAEAEKKSRRLLESLIECKIREWEVGVK